MIVKQYKMMLIKQYAFLKPLINSTKAWDKLIYIWQNRKYWFPSVSHVPLKVVRNVQIEDSIQCGADEIKKYPAFFMPFTSIIQSLYNDNDTTTTTTTATTTTTTNNNNNHDHDDDDDEDNDDDDDGDEDGDIVMVVMWWWWWWWWCDDDDDDDGDYDDDGDGRSGDGDSDNDDNNDGHNNENHLIALSKSYN